MKKTPNPVEFGVSNFYCEQKFSQYSVTVNFFQFEMICKSNVKFFKIVIFFIQF